MKLTVLGCATPFPRLDRPCSGYLVSREDSHVLLDCGSGVFPILLEYLEPRRLSAVWISHMHPDHCADLAALANWALNTEDAPRVRVFGPAGWDRRLNSFISEDASRNLVGEIFDVGYLEDGATFTAGGFVVTSRMVHHSVPTYGVRISDGTSTFAYSGDTGVCPSLEVLAANVDLFLCEAGSDEPVEYHLTAQQAYDVALNANAGKLLITHVPDGLVVEVPVNRGLNTEVVQARDEWLITSSGSGG